MSRHRDIRHRRAKRNTLGTRATALGFTTSGGRGDHVDDAGLPAHDRGDLAPRRARCYGDSECVTWTEGGPAPARPSPQVGANGPTGSRARCARLGIEPGDRVGTFMWNTQEHLEAYFAVPCDGRGAAHAQHPAVPRAARLRRQPRARTSVVIVDDSLVPVLAQGRGRAHRPSSATSSSATATRRALDGDRRRDRSATTSCSRPSRPEFDVARDRRTRRRRRCVTRAARPATRRASSTRTARRSCTRSRRRTPAALGLTERDRVLPIVPMFHANAWGMPYAAFMCGATSLMPGRFLQAEPLTRMIKRGARHVLGRGADDLGRHPPLRRGARRSTSRRCAWSSAAARPCRAR